MSYYHTVISFTLFLFALTLEHFVLQIVWRPYAPLSVRDLLPDYCLIAPEIWRASVPLICFHIVEWHHADRVLRQFGMQQPIPTAAVDLAACHTIQLRGKQEKDWMYEHRGFIESWNGRMNAIAQAPLSRNPISRTSQYMRWYWRITRRWIHPASGAQGFVVYFPCLMSMSLSIC